MVIKMKYKYIKINLNKFKIEYNGTHFEDINEFVIDLRNIFIQITEIYKIFKKKENDTNEKTELKNQESIANEKLKSLQNELQKKLDYITDSNRISETLLGKVRSKLIQLKSLNKTTDITKDSEYNIGRLVDFYYKRILEEKSAVIRKKHFYK